MKLVEIDWSRTLGDARYRSFLTSTDGLECEAIDLYIWNIRASTAIFELIAVLEVALRNSIVHRLSDMSDGNWIEFLRPLLTDRASFSLSEAIERSTSSAGEFREQQVVSELSLGFWVLLYSRRYEMKLWRAGLSQMFSSTNHFSRGDVYSALIRIKSLRNRIAHHEPIYERDLADDIKQIYFILQLISTDLVEWASSISRVPEYQECPWVVTP